MAIDSAKKKKKNKATNIALIEYIPGILVPSATKTIAVTESLIPSVQPKCDATSPITAVTTPIQKIDTTKHM